MAHDPRASTPTQGRKVSPLQQPVSLEDRLYATEAALAGLAAGLAGVDPEEVWADGGTLATGELLAGGLDTLASLVTRMAAEARGERVDR